MNAKSDRPRTAEQFAALPEGPELSVRRYEITAADRERGYAEISGVQCEVSDGVRFINIPVPPDLVAFFSEDTDVISWCDADGIGWSLGRYADGRWFRQMRLSQK